MRTNAIIRIILFSLAIVVLLSILGVGIAARMYMVDSDFFGPDADVVTGSEGAADPAEIRDISIEWAAGSITIVRADTDIISFRESGSFDENEKMVWTQSGEDLNIQYQKTAQLFGLSADTSKDLVITVPMDWTCKVLEIDAAAAEIEVDSLTIQKVDFDGASGHCSFENCVIDTIEMDTASGNVDLSGTLNELDFDGASADCTIVLTNCPRRIEMDMASGDLDLTLPEACGFTASMDALSGSLDSDFDITRIDGGFISGDGSCRIDISAMSGDVFIHKATQSPNADH